MAHSVSALRRDEAGNLSVITALAGIPLVLSMMMAMEFSMATTARQEAGAALDSAVLAAVADQSVDAQEREKLLHTVFADNYVNDIPFEAEVIEDANGRMRAQAKGRYTSGIAGLTGIEIVPLSAEAAAEVTKKFSVCVMTLNPDGEESFYVYGVSRFASPTCAVQVNSKHARASVVESGSRASASDFCVVGGASGDYYPHVNTQCSKLDDPYANYTAPPSGPCLPNPHQPGGGGKGKNSGSSPTPITLVPGTYCDGITGRGTTMTLESGIYILDNSELWLAADSFLQGNGVTFVLRGPDAVIYIERGSQVDIKAPTPDQLMANPTTQAYAHLAGLAVFQEASSATSGKMPSATSELSGGSRMDITGTVYLPTQRIEVWKEGGYAGTAPATAYIGYDVHLGNGSQVEVAADHSAAGLPPFLPRSDEGVRLIP